MDNYDKERNKKIDIILDVLYRLDNGTLKTNACSKKQIELCQDRDLVDYLTSEGIVQIYTRSKTQSIVIELTHQGNMIIEKYGSWTSYFKKVINRQTKTESAKSIATRFWWLPIALSAFALLLSIFAFFKN